MGLPAGCELGDLGATKLAETTAVSGHLSSLELPDTPCEAGAPAVLRKTTFALQLNRMYCNEGGCDTSEPAGPSYSTNPLSAPGTARPSCAGQPRDVLRKGVCIQEVSPKTPTGLAYTLRVPPPELGRIITWESTGRTSAPESPASYSLPVDVELRMQAIEERQALMAGEVETLRSLGVEFATWKDHVDANSSELVDVLTTAVADIAGVRWELAAVKENFCQLQRQPPVEWGLGARLTQLEAAYSSSHSHLQAATAELADWKQAVEAKLVALQECARQQAALQARQEEAQRKQAEADAQRAARKACLDATLRQLQASAAPQQLRRQSGSAWGLRTLLVPLSAAAAAAAGVAAARWLNPKGYLNGPHTQVGAH